MAKVKTLAGTGKYIFIDGEGRNQERNPQNPPRMMYSASLVVPKDGPVHKDMLEQINAEWADYKNKFGVKGLPKTNGIKEEMQNDPSGEIDPATEKVKRIPTGNVVIGFKTNTKWPDGNPQIVKVFANQKDATGKTYAADVTEQVTKAPWSIGNDSEIIIHGTAMGNNVGGDHKVTLYLSAVQIVKLVKYEGTDVQADEVDDAEVVDFGDEAGIDDAPTAAVKL